MEAVVEIVNCFERLVSSGDDLADGISSSNNRKFIEFMTDVILVGGAIGLTLKACLIIHRLKNL